MQLQKVGQSPILEQNGLLINLEVRVWLAQVVHFHDQELVGALAHSVLELLNLWLDLLETDRVLSDRLRWMLNVEDHVVELVDFLDVLIEVIIDVGAEQVVHHLLRQQSVVQVVREELVEGLLMGEIEALAFVLQVPYFVRDVLELALEPVDNGLDLAEDLLGLVDVLVQLEGLLVQAHEVERALVLQLVQLLLDLLCVRPDVERLPLTRTLACTSSALERR